MNRCGTKFTWFIGYEQFRCHNFFELCKVYRAESRVFRQTRFLGDFASVFEVSCNFKGRDVYIERLSQLCYTAVAKMPRR